MALTSNVKTNFTQLKYVHQVCSHFKRCTGISTIACRNFNCMRCDVAFHVLGLLFTITINDDDDHHDDYNDDVYAMAHTSI